MTPHETATLVRAAQPLAPQFRQNAYGDYIAFKCGCLVEAMLTGLQADPLHARASQLVNQLPKYTARAQPRMFRPIIQVCRPCCPDWDALSDQYATHYDALKTGVEEIVWMHKRIAALQQA